MRKASSLLLTAVTAILGLAAPQFARAQTQVSVTVTNSPVWDIDGALTNVDFSITNKDDTTELSTSFPIAAEQTGTGKLTGGPADTTVQLSIVGENSPNTNGAAAGSYRVAGSVTSINGKGRILANITVMSTEAWSDPVRKFRVIEKINAKFDNASLAIAGTETDSGTQIGGHHAGTLANRRSFSQSLSDFGNGSWTLSMTLATDANKITGTGTVTLNSGQAFTYNAKGTVKKDGTARILLTGDHTKTAGTPLQVTLSAANAVASVKGRITGQMVKVTF